MNFTQTKWFLICRPKSRTSQDNFKDLPVLYLFVGFFVMASFLLQCLFYCIKASSAISLAHESIDLFVLQSNELGACTLEWQTCHTWFLPDCLLSFSRQLNFQSSTCTYRIAKWNVSRNHSSPIVPTLSTRHFIHCWRMHMHYSPPSMKTQFFNRLLDLNGTSKWQLQTTCTRQWVCTFEQLKTPEN